MTRVLPLREKNATSDLPSERGAASAGVTDALPAASGSSRDDMRIFRLVGF